MSDDRIDDGGRAFPGEKDSRFGQDNDCNEGMSLRDWFAGQALAGILGCSRTYAGVSGKEGYAAHAYRIADEMIARRKKEAGA
jgi:hypothetical protein